MTDYTFGLDIHLNHVSCFASVKKKRRRNKWSEKAIKREIDFDIFFAFVNII